MAKVSKTMAQIQEKKMLFEVILQTKFWKEKIQIKKNNTNNEFLNFFYFWGWVGTHLNKKI